jgi:hypothetical protein
MPPSEPIDRAISADRQVLAAHLILGVLFVLVGAMFGRSGVRRRRKPRRAEDLEWDRNHPIRRALLDPTQWFTGRTWDRQGALNSVVAGLILIVLGLLLLASA